MRFFKKKKPKQTIFFTNDEVMETLEKVCLKQGKSTQPAFFTDDEVMERFEKIFLKVANDPKRKT